MSFSVKSKQYMRTIRRFSAVLIGIVFFVSGMLKLMDPVGTSLIVEEYLKFFRLGFLHFADYALGACLALAETILGAALITGVWKKAVGITVLAFLGFFTIVTLILLVFNPVMDCGCFGEAVHLTHLQSFLKNLVLLALWALAYIPMRSLEPTRKIKYGSFGLVAVSSLLFFLYSSLSLPLIDFTDYRPGTELMSWEDVDFSSGELPTVLSFSDVDGNYVDSLALSGRVLAVSAFDPARLSDAKWSDIESVVRSSRQEGYLPLVLVSSTPSQIEALAGGSPDLLSSVYFADRKTLLTLNRSNGGYTYIADGQIIRKWSSRKAPSRDYLAEISDDDPVEVFVSTSNSSSLKFQGFMLYVFAVMLLL